MLIDFFYCYCQWLFHVERGEGMMNIPYDGYCYGMVMGNVCMLGWTETDYAFVFVWCSMI